MPHYDSIYLLDGDQSSRRLLAARLGERGFEVWPFDTVDRFLAVLGTLRPACILLDVGIGSGHGVELIAHLRERSGGWPVVALDSAPKITTAVAAVRAGAEDFLEKTGDRDRLDRVLRAACSSLREAAEATGGRLDALARLASLTPREREVANSVLRGHSNKRAAYLLGISVRTVEMHRGRVMAKLGVRNMAEAAVLLAGLGFGDASWTQNAEEPGARRASSDRRHGVNA